MYSVSVQIQAIDASRHIGGRSDGFFIAVYTDNPDEVMKNLLRAVHGVFISDPSVGRLEMHRSNFRKAAIVPVDLSNETFGDKLIAFVKKVSTVDLDATTVEIKLLDQLSREATELLRAGGVE